MPICAPPSLKLAATGGADKLQMEPKEGKAARGAPSAFRPYCNRAAAQRGKDPCAGAGTGVGTGAGAGAGAGIGMGAGACQLSLGIKSFLERGASLGQHCTAGFISRTSSKEASGPTPLGLSKESSLGVRKGEGPGGAGKGTHLELGLSKEMSLGLSLGSFVGAPPAERTADTSACIDPCPMQAEVCHMGGQLRDLGHSAVGVPLAYWGQRDLGQGGLPLGQGKDPCESWSGRDTGATEAVTEGAASEVNQMSSVCSGVESPGYPGYSPCEPSQGPCSDPRGAGDKGASSLFLDDRRAAAREAERSLELAAAGLTLGTPPPRSPGAAGPRSNDPEPGLGLGLGLGLGPQSGPVTRGGPSRASTAGALAEPHALPLRLCSASDASELPSVSPGKTEPSSTPPWCTLGVPQPVVQAVEMQGVAWGLAQAPHACEPDRDSRAAAKFGDGGSSNVATSQEDGR